MKFNKMNGKRSLSPNSNNNNSFNKQFKQHNKSWHGNNSQNVVSDERKNLPMWAAKQSFLTEISK